MKRWVWTEGDESENADPTARALLVAVVAVVALCLLMAGEAIRGLDDRLTAVEKIIIVKQGAK
jgi:hypothetical protein